MKIIDDNDGSSGGMGGGKMTTKIQQCPKLSNEIILMSLCVHLNALRTARNPGLIPPAEEDGDAIPDDAGDLGDMTAGPPGDPSAGDPRPYADPPLVLRRPSPEDVFFTSADGDADDDEPNRPPPTLPRSPEKNPTGAGLLGDALALSLLALAARAACGLRAPTLTPPGSRTGPLPSRVPRVDAPAANGLRRGGTSTGRREKKPPPPLALDDLPEGLWRD